MILIGDKNIPYESICTITSIEEIAKSKPNSIVCFHFNLEILHYTAKNSINSAVIIKDITECIYASILGVRYIIVTEDLAVSVQDLADHYMFDSRILVIIEDSNQIEEFAKKHIDGVIYKELLG